MINESQIRGRICKFTNVLDNILTPHNYPLAISRLLGEMLIAAAIIGEMFKSKHLVTLQVKSKGAAELMIADYFAGGMMRGYAQINEELFAIDDEKTFASLLKEGILAVTLDQGSGTDLYQGIVELEGDDLASCIEQYFIRSEQVATCIKIAVGQDMSGGSAKWCAGGIMIQMMPNLTEEDIWHKNQLFMDSIKTSELIDPSLDCQTLLYRLFHEDGVWVDKASEVSSGCRCSRERFAGFLKNIPKLELPSYIVDGAVTFTCEFCSRSESFAGDELC